MSSVSSFANAMPTIARKNDLLKWIQQEERLVRIYQADLAVTQRKHQQQHRGEDPPDDWLETLDRLQSNDNSNSLDTKWHDDPIHRLLPRISGVQFTHIVQNQQQQQQDLHLYNHHLYWSTLLHGNPNPEHLQYDED